MSKKHVFTALVLGSAIGLAASPSWSQTSGQTKSGEDQNVAPGTDQPGTSGATRPGALKNNSGMSRSKSAQSAQKDMTKPGEEQNIPPGTQFGSSGMSKEDVRSVQQTLKSKGYDVGQIDGVIGQKSRTAIRAFQKDNNLPITGTVDQKTAEQLGVSLDTHSQNNKK